MVALFAWLISHQPAVLFSQNKPATSDQPAVLFSQNEPAPAISHQPTEQAANFTVWKRKILYLFTIENIDYVIGVPEPEKPKDDATDEEKKD
jgi:hypothetical protein